MKYPTIFHLISETFNKAGISAVLIGGFAVNYYKVTRQTADVDFLATKKDFEKAMVLLAKEGYREDYMQENFARLKGNPSYLMDIDFMFVDKSTFEKIIEAGKAITIAGQKFIIPSVEHLIALKLHSIKCNPKLRENKDMSDIIDLMRANKIDVKKDNFKELCLKYGNKDLYDKIFNRCHNA
ncbi:MAG: nucleotidyltransferase [Candidatus Omnitrophota bacterium]|nr:nucleotidyltransferase [Candidatus Omnitrophota bacterium]